MPAQLEIIWTDRAGGAPSPMRTPGSAQPAERTPGPGDSVSGPQKRDASLTNGADLESSAQKLANVLGVGGLMGSAIELRREFRKLFDAVSDSSRALKGVRGSDVGGGRIGEVKSPVSGPVATEGPAAPSIPSVGTFERQAAKGAIEAPPVSRAVAGPVPSVGWFEKTVAAKGGAVAPPVVGSVAGPAAGAAAAGAGPAAGAGSAAGAMAALSVAAGPLAIAFAVTTAAVVAGAAAAKKFADAIERESSRLARYSGPLSASESRNEIREEFAAIRRAQSVGPGLARANDFRGQVNDQLARAMDELVRAFADFVDDNQDKIQTAINLLELLVDYFASTAANVEFLKDLMAGRLSDIPEDLKRINRASERFNSDFKKFLDGEKDPFDMRDDPALTSLMNNFSSESIGSTPVTAPSSASLAGP